MKLMIDSQKHPSFEGRVDFCIEEQSGIAGRIQI
jgi:hypothetical protein